jgi:phosphoribosylaminoimidazolecarboxamide formyltransferase/IMP cyclohydrolase
MRKIKKALLSVFDKKDLIQLSRKLREFDIEIVSTGQTFKVLKEAGVKVQAVLDVTGFPEILDGRVKTLHPKIHGGILARRDKKEHLEQLKSLQIEPFDLVIVNLYPFEKVVASDTVSEKDVLENIDIGGPAMLRAAAKNFPDVTVISDPSDYVSLLEELDKGDGSVGLAFRKRMATLAFARTAAYDSAITAYFSKESSDFPVSLNLNYRLKGKLRYGENPHQKGALYEMPGFPHTSLACAKLLSGKELSFNNIWDLEAGLQMICDFEKPFAAVIKHANPCGAALGKDLAQAYTKALDSDPLSAFGSVIALNQSVDLETAKLLHETPFVECILAPCFDADSVDLLSQKKNRRLLEVGKLTRPPQTDYEFRPLTGGLLAQTPDRREVLKKDLTYPTKLKPTEEEIDELIFAFKIVKHVKSNAVVICKEMATVGIGPGQTSRVESSIIAARKAGQKAVGAVAASDAFFPMPDGLEVLIEAGVKAIIQPGGSKKDAEVIETADRFGATMVFCGIRHFKH